MKRFSISNEGEIKIPEIDFEGIKNEALGADYNLSLVFTTPDKMKKLNLIYRDKNQPTDILSFPIENNEGEIYISLEEAQKEAKKFDRPYENFIAFLFIHGCVHLKGHDHGSTMENIEVKLRDKFNI
jgi:probable rRNA maturation factor